jgi:hypothetical protein
VLLRYELKGRFIDPHGDEHRNRCEFYAIPREAVDENVETSQSIPVCVPHHVGFGPAGIGI